MSLIMDLISRYLGYYSIFKNNLFLIPVFGFLELAIISTLYYKYILKIKSVPLLLFIVTMLLIILYEIIIAPILPYRKYFFSIGKIIADVSVIFFCMYYYWRVFKWQIPIKSQYNLMNAAIFIYYSISLLNYLTINFLINEKLSIVTFFWVIRFISMILFYLVLIYLIWQDGKTRKILR